MLQRDRAEWKQLVALLDAQPGTPVHGPGSPDWNARDVYTHFAHWIAHSTDDFEATLAGKRGQRLVGTDDEINARWQQEDAALSLDDARRLAQRAFDRRIEVLESTPGDRWNPTLDAIAHADGYEHIAAHRRYIESSRA
jgi:Mycothiol maleylpyruvate isomerase N-terminal domain.